MPIGPLMSMTVASSVLCGGLTGLLFYKIGTPVWLTVVASALGGPALALCMIVACFLTIGTLSGLSNRYRE